MKKIILALVASTSLMVSCKKSDTVTPTNASPSITLAYDDRNARVDNTNTYSYSFMATATDTDGTISKVVFYADNTPYDTVTVSSGSNKYYNDNSYTANKTGDIVFTAKAMDNGGAVKVSNSITVTIPGEVKVVKAQ